MGCGCGREPGFRRGEPVAAVYAFVARVASGGAFGAVSGGRGGGTEPERDLLFLRGTGRPRLVSKRNEAFHVSVAGHEAPGPLFAFGVDEKITGKKICGKENILGGVRSRAGGWGLRRMLCGP